MLCGLPYFFMRRLSRISAAFSIAALGGDHFEHFAFVADRAPQIMELAVDFDEHLVEMPPPIRKGTGRPNRFFLISAANIGPKRFHQWRTVSWRMSMLRSANRSSTFRSDSGYFTYINTVRGTISGELLKYLNGLRIR